MINWFWQISHKFDTKLFFGDCDNTPVYNIFGSLLDFEMTSVPHLHEYWSSRDDQDMQLYLMQKNVRDEFTFTLSSRVVV